VKKTSKLLSISSEKRKGTFQEQKGDKISKI
jgi:hypothetical protein